jgi:hypothetical protein
MARLLEAAGDGATASALPVPSGSTGRTRPEAGDVVQVRHRQYLVEEVVPPGDPGEASRIVLSGLEDDNQGRRLEVLWEIELGGRILQPQLHGPDTRSRLDPPRAFAAYLNALRWNAVTATDARLFQAPFRAGILIILHQLTPLKRALDLPRGAPAPPTANPPRHSTSSKSLSIWSPPRSSSPLPVADNAIPKRHLFARFALFTTFCR